VLTAVQNPDGLTSTSTGKGPAVALMKLRDRALALRKTEPAGSAGSASSAAPAISTSAAVPTADEAPDKVDVHHPVA
jgi:hypothetical protein